MSAFEQELYEDLAYEEAEGMSDLYDEDLEMDEMDDYDEDESDDEFDDEDEFEESAFYEDEFDEFDEVNEYDEFDEFDEDDEFEDEGEEALDSVMAFALDSEDADEFFKKLFRGAKKFAKKAVRVARKAAPIIGKIGRIAAPILSKIPLPQAQLAARVARLAGRLRAEGASDEEILEAVAEIATKDKRALPIVAGLTAQTILKGRGRAMSFPARKKVVKDMKKAAKTLVRKQGPKAIRALPKIVKSVKRTTARKPTPIKAKTMIVKRSATKVAKSPTLIRKLAKPKVKAIMAAKKVVRARSYTIPGPSKITITAV
jgi:hypothetical protein